jgi:hypothetical protein
VPLASVASPIWGPHCIVSEDLSRGAWKEAAPLPAPSLASQTAAGTNLRPPTYSRWQMPEGTIDPS